MKHSPEEDRQLLSRCIAGDRRSYDTFVKRFSNLIYQSIRNTLIIKEISFTNQDLEDLHNTAFLQLFEGRLKKLRQYKGKNGCSLASWIRLVTIRIVLNQLRKKGVDGISWKIKQIRLEDLYDLREDDKNAWALLEGSEQERLLQEGIRNLYPRDRLFMKLHFERELSIQEVAKTMGLSVQNIYTVKNRTIQRLKSHVISVLNDQY
jgi:RNA polymerase sigma factor (sigma-70 family)